MRTAHCASWSEGSSLGLAKAGKRSFGRRANVGFGLWGSFKGSFQGPLEGPSRHYSRSPKVGNPIASILKSTVEGIPALFGLYPVSNFMGFTVLGFRVYWF